MDIHLLFSFFYDESVIFEEKVRIILLPNLSCCRYNVNVCILL